MAETDRRSKTPVWPEGTVAPRNPSDRYPLDEVARHLPLPAVVEAGGPGIGMAQEVLHLTEGNALVQQVRRRGQAEGVRREALRQTGILQPPLHHPAAIDGAHRALREFL